MMDSMKISVEIQGLPDDLPDYIKYLVCVSDCGYLYFHSAHGSWEAAKEVANYSCGAVITVLK